MVVRAAGFLVSAKVFTTEDILKLVHTFPSPTRKKGKRKKGPIEIALGNNKKPTLAEVIAAVVAPEVKDPFAVSGYPSKTAMAYWFVDGITKVGIEIDTKAWGRIADWASAEFDRQLTYVVAQNDALMDPAALAMAASLISRICVFLAKPITIPA